MAIPSAVGLLTNPIQAALQTVVRPKLEAYFHLTSYPGAPPRAVPDPHGQPWFIYPVPALITDLAFLWSLFSDVYQVVGGPAELAKVVRADSNLLDDVRRIVEGTSPSDQDGSFWHFPRGLISINDAIDAELPSVLQTLRNGFAHSHWLCENLAAADYWKTLGWSTSGVPASCPLLSYPVKNYRMFIADARDWDASAFWSLRDLRILVTPAHILRYHLHLFVSYVVTGQRLNVFGG